MSTNIQVGTFIFLFFWGLFVVYARIFIYVFIVKELVFTCVIYAATVYHQSERYIPHFCVTWVLVLEIHYPNNNSEVRRVQGDGNQPLR